MCFVFLSCTVLFAIPTAHLLSHSCSVMPCGYPNPSSIFLAQIALLMTSCTATCSGSAAESGTQPITCEVTTTGLEVGCPTSLQYHRQRSPPALDRPFASDVKDASATVCKFTPRGWNTNAVFAFAEYVSNSAVYFMTTVLASGCTVVICRALGTENSIGAHGLRQLLTSVLLLDHEHRLTGRGGGQETSAGKLPTAFPRIAFKN